MDTYNRLLRNSRDPSLGHRLSESPNLPSLIRERKLITASKSRINLLEPAGFWTIACDYMKRDNNGLTEMDRVWLAAKELVTEGIFLEASCYTPGCSPLKNNFKPHSTLLIYCYVENYLEIENVILSADEFRKKVHYPYPMYMKTNRISEDGKRETVTKYLYCLDGDIYELTTIGFKLVKFSTLVS